jgi:hypothetical protein
VSKNFYHAAFDRYALFTASEQDGQHACKSMHHVPERLQAVPYGKQVS